jgi:hypothetical protein
MNTMLLDLLMVFAGGFASVFTLAFQSRAVNAGNYKLAAVMSFTIAMSQAHLWKLIADGDGSLLTSATYGLSGSAAITSAIWVYQRYFDKREQTT